MNGLQMKEIAEKVYLGQREAFDRFLKNLLMFFWLSHEEGILTGAEYLGKLDTKSKSTDGISMPMEYYIELAYENYGMDKENISCRMEQYLELEKSESYKLACYLAFWWMQEAEEATEEMIYKTHELFPVIRKETMERLLQEGITQYERVSRERIDILNSHIELADERIEEIDKALMALPRKELEFFVNWTEADTLGIYLLLCDARLKEKITGVLERKYLQGPEQFTLSLFDQVITELSDAREQGFGLRIPEYLVGKETFGEVTIAGCSVNLKDRDVREKLAEASLTDIALTMKLLDENSKKRLLRALPERMRDFIRESLEYMGPVRMCDAEEAAENLTAYIEGE